MALEGTMIEFMTDEDLLNDLNIKVRLHRVKIIEGIKKLKASQNPIVNNMEG